MESRDSSRRASPVHSSISGSANANVSTASQLTPDKMQALRKRLKTMSAKKLLVENPFIDENEQSGVRESKSEIFQRQSFLRVPKATQSAKLTELALTTAKSPLDQDLAIQNNRVLNIMDRAIEKMEILVYLPTLLKNNGCILKKFFGKDDYQFILYTCAPYTECVTERDLDYSKIAQIENKIVKIRGTHLSATKSMSRIESAMDSSFIFKKPLLQEKMYSIEKVDPMMSKTVEMILSNEKLRNAIRNGKIVLNDDMAKTYIHCWKILREGSLKKLTVSAKDEAARENMLRKLWRSNKECVAKIEQITETLHRQKTLLGKELQARYEVIDNYNNSMEKMRNKFRDDLKKKIAISEKSMAENTVASEARQMEMQQEIDTLKEQFEQVLRDNLMSEKVLRKKKYKIESQLASWLSKYDNDVGERQAEYDEIAQLYEEELRETTDLQEKFDSQEEEYITLMAEKEEEERLMMEDIVREFLRNHSARVIQWSWKAYKARKLARKLARKNKRKGQSVKLAGFTPPPVIPPPPVKSTQPADQSSTQVENKLDNDGTNASTMSANQSVETKEVE